MKYFFISIILGIVISSNARDAIEIKLNKLSFNASDTIEFSCRINDYASKKLAAATLNVWIQDIVTKRTWKFRYPVINGEIEASLIVTDSIRSGKYAMNFILQPGLFRIVGDVKNTGENSLNYIMRLKNGQKLINAVPVNAAGYFTVKNILFENDAVIAFAPSKKGKRNELNISIATPMDSAFTPIAVFTQLIDIKPGSLQTSLAGSSYQFNFERTYNNTTLPEVIVTGKQKRKVDEFNEKFSIGLFQGENKLFDGLESDEIAATADIETFLQKHVPGLIFTRAAGDANGMTYITWRNEPIVIYIDEIPLDTGENIYVTPSDVAMIKVYNPPAMVNIAGRTAGDPTSKVFSGAIAIYTKRANFGLHDDKNRHSFNIKGYTPLAGIWQ